MCDAHSILYGAEEGSVDDPSVRKPYILCIGIAKISDISVCIRNQCFCMCKTDSDEEIKGIPGACCCDQYRNSFCP